MNSLTFFGTVIVCAASAFGCANAPAGASENQVFEASDQQSKYRVETVATGLEVPWAFAFLPNGNLLFTERRGRVRLIESGSLRADPIYVVPDVEPSSE